MTFSHGLSIIDCISCDNIINIWCCIYLLDHIYGVFDIILSCIIRKIYSLIFFDCLRH